MTADTPAAMTIEALLDSWEKGPIRDWFALCCRELAAMAGVSLEFVGRPGISYSLRPRHRHQKARRHFAVVDVIDDEPAARWLSVCFYRDMITDPEGLGELIPGGLDGGDGYCFDLTAGREEMGPYLLARLQEARTAAETAG